jgi:fermentation-respiration switch protein FrsA (DUF1100 family)
MKLPAISRQLAELFEQVKASPKPTGAAAAEDKLAWFREHAENDPLANVRRVRVPVLILNGERDALVLPYHAVELARALAGAGNKRTTLRIFPNLTHLFTPSGLDASARDKTGEVSPEVLNTLQTWFADVLGKK